MGRPGRRDCGLRGGSPRQDASTYSTWERRALLQSGARSHGSHLTVSLSSGVVESAALVVWLRRQISQKAFLFTDIQQVVEFVRARPLVVVGFFQVPRSRGGGLGGAFWLARSRVSGRGHPHLGQFRTRSSFPSEPVFGGNCRVTMRREKMEAERGRRI